jgi:hypothetical protein
MLCGKRSSKDLQLSLRFFIYPKQNDYDSAKSIFSLHFNGDNKRTNGTRYVKFSAETNHEHIYKFRVKHFY